MPLPATETMLAKALSLMTADQRVKYLEWLDRNTPEEWKPKVLFGGKALPMPLLPVRVADPDTKVY